MGSGLKKLIGGTVKTDIEAEEAKGFLLDGFFPLCELEDEPQSSLAAGIQEVGLPYASDAAITSTPRSLHLQAKSIREFSLAQQDPILTAVFSTAKPCGIACSR